MTCDRFFFRYSTNKTDCHKITEILLKVALNTIILALYYVQWVVFQLYSGPCYCVLYMYQLWNILINIYIDNCSQLENKESNNNSNYDATESYFSFFLQIMDQYTILGRIGEGAHGIVLKAKHIEVIVKDCCTSHLACRFLLLFLTSVV